MKKAINPLFKTRCVEALRAKGFQFTADTVEVTVETDSYSPYQNPTDLLVNVKEPSTRVFMTVLLRHPRVHGDNEWAATKLKLGLHFSRQQIRNWDEANSDTTVEKFIRYLNMRSQTYIERGTLTHLIPKRTTESALH